MTRTQRIRIAHRNMTRKVKVIVTMRLMRWCPFCGATTEQTKVTTEQMWKCQACKGENSEG